jgi:hypothetical protein
MVFVSDDSGATSWPTAVIATDIVPSTDNAGTSDHESIDYTSGKATTSRVALLIALQHGDYGSSANRNSNNQNHARQLADFQERSRIRFQNQGIAKTIR